MTSYSDLENITKLEKQEQLEPKSKAERVEKSFGADFFTFLAEDDPRSIYVGAMPSLDASFLKEPINSKIFVNNNVI